MEETRRLVPVHHPAHEPEPADLSWLQATGRLVNYEDGGVRVDSGLEIRATKTSIVMGRQVRWIQL